MPENETATQADKTATQAEMTCDQPCFARCIQCPEPAVVFVPGTEEVRDIFLLVAGTPDRQYCLHCAKEAGWPWLLSETRKQRREWTGQTAP